MFKKVTSIGVVFLLIFVAACADGEEKSEEDITDDTIVATVNGMEIKGEDYNFAYEQLEQLYEQTGQDLEDEEIAETIKETVLEQLIGQTVLLYYAEQNGFEAEDEEVEQELNTIKEQYEEDEFARVLEDSGITEEQLREEMANQIKTNKFIDQEIGSIDVSEEEVQEYYETYKEQMGEEAKELEDVEEVIKRELENQKRQEKAKEIVDELKEKSDIEILI
ncbi:SurA-like protein [Melghiribacillus thermohalophilus]|uniref:SurA-like protein n=1 Tax=Melghiribacillus thermohalophilus TaxID=1324956 RepID=A0A4R3MST9_9BACI|nr:SurA N-terminal domain-containing protein [Melghiribacillus thermohalophilus]TCT18787.1 SurA-like protein [Melghiribacillus thermohalophilus]